MQIKAEVKGKTVTIDIQNKEYWIKRKEKKMSAYWSETDNVEKRLRKEFKKAYKQLEKEFYAYSNIEGVDGKLSYGKKRIASLMKEFRPYIDDLYNYQQTTVTDHLIETYADNFNRELYELSNGIHVATTFVKPDKRAIEAAISHPWSGASFSDRIYNNKNKLVRVLKEEITQSLIRGDAPKATARTMSKRLNISTKNAERLVQTETAAVISESNKKAYDDFGLDKYEYISTLDSRTSEQCKNLDGKIFNVEDMQVGVNAPALHPR
jgi:SPP1 gp7 family putative phage head morphogenesis protein